MAAPKLVLETDNAFPALVWPHDIQCIAITLAGWLDYLSFFGNSCIEKDHVASNVTIRSIENIGGDTHLSSPSQLHVAYTCYTPEVLQDARSVEVHEIS